MRRRSTVMRDIFTEAGEEKSVDFLSNVVDWINCCLDDGGVPQFRTRYGGRHYPDMVLGVCWDGAGVCKGQWFKDVPAEDVIYMDNHRDDYRHLLEKYGGIVRRAHIRPDIGREILAETVGDKVNPIKPEEKLIEQIMRRMYEEHKHEIMRHVHRKNPFGQSETQIDFFEDGRVLLHDHATPSITYYDFEQPIFSFAVTWDPFISERDLDETFEYYLEQFLEHEKARIEMEEDFYKHPEDYPSEPSDTGARVEDFTEEMIRVGKNMERFGGGFASRLGSALLKADLENARRIKKAFPELWEQYGRMK